MWMESPSWTLVTNPVWVALLGESEPESPRTHGDRSCEWVFRARCNPALLDSSAQSVAKWVFKHFNSEEFRAIQVARGARKGQKTRDTHLERTIEMAAQGFSQRAISAELGVPRTTIATWLKRGVDESHIR